MKSFAPHIASWLVAALASSVAVADEAAPGPHDSGGHALRTDLFVSSDADGAATTRWSLGWDTWRADREHWRGLRVERARFSGPGWSHAEERLYLQAAGTFGDGPVDDDTWRWRAAAGSNGHDLLGSAALHTEGPRRREFFIERELVETRAGTRRGQVYTFAGAAFDHPFGEHTSGTVLAGLQDFDDGNLRTHLRGTLAHAFAPDAGLSLQLRTRAYRNSRPGAGDYYSPRWYGDAVVGIGWRRFFGGHRVGVFAGAGGRRTAGETGWERMRVLQFGYETPRRHDSFARLSAGWSDTPATTSVAGGRYAYRYVMFEGVVAF